jgi:hypothetical protein
MTFLNVQLIYQGYDFFSSIDKVILKAKSQNRYVFTDEEKSKLEKNDLVMRMKLMMTDNTYQPYFFDELKKYYPSVVSYVQKKFEDQEFEKVNPLNYFYDNINLFRAMMIISMKTYFVAYEPNAKTKVTVKRIQERLKLVEDKLGDSNLKDQNLKNKLLIQKNYLSAKAALTEAESNLKVQLIKIFLAMIHRNFEKRISLDNVVEFVQLCYQQFNENLDELEEVVLYEEDVPDETNGKTIDFHNLDDTISYHRKIKSDMMRDARIKIRPQPNVHKMKRKINQVFSEVEFQGKRYLVI